MKQTCIMVSPVCPDPHGSGLEQRAFHLLCDYAEQYRVTLVLAGVVPLPPQMPAATRACVSTLVHLHTRAVSPFLQRLALLFPVLAWLHPLLAAGWLTLHPTAPLPELPGEIALLIVFRLRTSTVAQSLLAPHRGVVRSILDFDDHESTTLRSIGWIALRRGRLRLALRSLAASAQLFGLERKLLRAYQEITIANPADRSALQRFISPGQNLRVRSNQVLLPPPAPRPARHHLFTMLFFGTLNYFPNEDAALWIAQQVVPALRRHVQVPFRILIAGRGASKHLERELHGIEEVVHLGPVQDVGALYAQADIALVAMRCGGGTKVKLLEAAAHLCPIVATPHSVRGLHFVHGEDLLCAPDPAGFAQHCAAIQRSPEVAEGRAARAYARVAEMCS